MNTQSMQLNHENKIVDPSAGIEQNASAENLDTTDLLRVIVPDPITDGSATLAHDGYDVTVWREALADYNRLNQAVDHASRKLVTAPALMRDLFLSFLKRVPQLLPPVPLTPAYEINSEIVSQVMSTTEWRQVREAGTVDDPLAAAMATIGVAEKTLAALDRATVERINHLHELESGAADLWDQVEVLEDLAQQALGDRAADLFARAEAARLQAQQQETEAESVEEELSVRSEERGDTVRRAARQGMASAETEISDTNAAVKAFDGEGSGYGLASGGKGGASRILTTKEKIDLASRVGRSKRLQQIAALCGRLSRIALQVQETRVKHPPDEVTEVGLGQDLAHLLPSELALLANPELEDLFFLRFAEGRLLQYELKGHEKLGQGPILVALDNSGSMSGDKETWSKGVTLALLAIARRQGRDMAVFHFSDAGSLAVHHFPKGRAEHSAVIACIEHFFGGGTAFEPWMAAALKQVDDSKFEAADVICISDGLSNISPEMQAEWNRRRKERGMRAFAVLIGTNEGAGLLAAISDAVLTLSDLSEDQPVLQTIFAI